MKFQFLHPTYKHLLAPSSTVFLLTKNGHLLIFFQAPQPIYLLIYVCQILRVSMAGRLGFSELSTLFQQIMELPDRFTANLCFGGRNFNGSICCLNNWSFSLSELWHCSNTYLYVSRPPDETTLGQGKAFTENRNKKWL